jgi:aryl-alcohol dehydrogenase-like predicted oxidoreductase
MLLPTAVASGLGVIGRSCFAAGLLVGDHPNAELREVTPDWHAIVAFRDCAARLGRTRKELALQYNLSTESIAVTLVGMRSPSQVDEVVGLVAKPGLTSHERAAVLAGVDG